MPRTAFAAFMLLFAVRMAVLVVCLAGPPAGPDGLRAAIAPVEPGARVFVAGTPEDAPDTGRRAPQPALSIGDRSTTTCPRCC